MDVHDRGAAGDLGARGVAFPGRTAVRRQTAWLLAAAPAILQGMDPGHRQLWSHQRVQRRLCRARAHTAVSTGLAVSDASRRARLGGRALGYVAGRRLSDRQRSLRGRAVVARHQSRCAITSCLPGSDCRLLVDVADRTLLDTLTNVASLRRP